MWLGEATQSRHHVSLVYGLDDVRFETALWYEDVDLHALEATHGAAFMARWRFHLLLMEASKLVSLRPDVLDLGVHARWYTPALATMWRDVLRHVWGQWRYLHDDPDYLGPQVLTEPLDVPATPVHITPGLVDILAFCGGGKDSLVGAKLLERAEIPFATFAYSHSVYGRAQPQHALIDRVVNICHGSDHHRLRVFDSAAEAPLTSLFPDVHEVLAAETPCSLFAALPVLLYHGHRAMVLAHERSANTGNLIWARTGEDINHQWGKSYAAERLLNRYIQRELVANATYFSVLQPVHDAVIFNLLRQDEASFPLTHSCNLSKPWCGQCPKCAYVWLNAMAWLNADTLPTALGGPMAEPLFDLEIHQTAFRQMLGLGEHTPFECIGQVEEVQLAFELCRRKGLRGRAMTLYTEHFPQLDVASIAQRFLSVDMTQSAIPPAWAQRLAPLLQTGADDGRAYLNALCSPE